MEKQYSDTSSAISQYQDLVLQKEITRKLEAVSTWDTTDVRVSVTDGIALLTGTVENTKAVDQTVLLVFTVKGLQKIDNKIKIRRETTAPNISKIAPAPGRPDNDDSK